MLILFYMSGTIASATFNIFDWCEGARIAISSFYPCICILFNALIIVEYNPKKP